MVSFLAQKEQFPKYPVEIQVRLEKLHCSKTPWRAFVSDSSGVDTIVLFGTPHSPLIEGKSYSFMVTLGKEYYGKRDFITSLDNYPYEEVPDVKIPDTPLSVTDAVQSPGYLFCVKAAVKKKGLKTISKPEKTLYLWSFDLSDGTTTCPANIWGDTTDPLPEVSDGTYYVYCPKYVPSKDPKYPIGSFDVKNARWVRLEGDFVPQSLPSSSSAQCACGDGDCSGECTCTPPPSAPEVPVCTPAPAPAPASSQQILSNQPRRVIEAIGGSPHLPADAAGIMHSLGEARLMVSCLEKIFESAAEYEKMHGAGSFYKTSGSVDTLAVLRDGSVSIPVINASSVNFVLDVFRTLLETAPLRRD